MPTGHAEHVQEPAVPYDVDRAMTEEHLRRELAELLRAQVAAMNLNNFIVRPKRRLVEKYAKPETWSVLNEEDFAVLTRDVAGLPSELVDEDEEAKRFDLLMLRLQLSLLRVEPGFEQWRDQVRAIAALLAGVYGALQCKTSEVSQPQGVEGSKAVLPY
jgi:type I site-specific restriction endonuclease